MDSQLSLSVFFRATFANARKAPVTLALLGAAGVAWEDFGRFVHGNSDEASLLWSQFGSEAVLCPLAVLILHALHSGDKTPLSAHLAKFGRKIVPIILISLAFLLPLLLKALLTRADAILSESFATMVLMFVLYMALFALIYLSLRLAFAVCALLCEGRTIAGACRQSLVLTRGRILRILAFPLPFYALSGLPYLLGSSPVALAVAYPLRVLSLALEWCLTYALYCACRDLETVADTPTTT